MIERGAGYDAVLLAGFGGPEGPEDVMPFLRNVTRGRGIPDERLVEVSHHYRALGGVSPINQQNRALRAALEAELRRRAVTVPVLWGNRNWAPFLTDVVARAHADGHRRLLAVTTSAYSSYSSCRQYREDFGAALVAGGLLGVVEIDKVRPYFDTAGFLDPVAEGLRAALGAAADAGIEVADTEVVFTTHSIPVTMADAAGSAEWGDHVPPGAYVRQHLQACRTVIERCRIPQVRWQLAYQSRSGPPSMPWLEPDVNDVIGDLAAAGRRGVVVVPIGFISDHVEVVWDLDHEARATAAAHGLWFHRCPTPGNHPAFVAMLADLVQQRLSDGREVPTATGTAPRPGTCPAACCVNARGVKPTTAGADSAADLVTAGAFR